jgi:hypothetical protein
VVDSCSKDFLVLKRLYAVPGRYAIYKERRLVVLTASGRFTFDEIRAIQDQLKKDPDFNPDFNLLTDLTGVTVFDMSVDEAKEIARTSVFSAASRRASLATQPSIYGMGRLMQVYREMAKLQKEGQIFYDREEALKYLGIGDDTTILSPPE